MNSCLIRLLSILPFIFLSPANGETFSGTVYGYDDYDNRTPLKKIPINFKEIGHTISNSYGEFRVVAVDNIAPGTELSISIRSKNKVIWLPYKGLYTSNVNKDKNKKIELYLVDRNSHKLKSISHFNRILYDFRRSVATNTTAINHSNHDLLDNLNKEIDSFYNLDLGTTEKFIKSKSKSQIILAADKAFINKNFKTAAGLYQKHAQALVRSYFSNKSLQKCKTIREFFIKSSDALYASGSYLKSINQLELINDEWMCSENMNSIFDVQFRLANSHQMLFRSTNNVRYFDISESHYRDCEKLLPHINEYNFFNDLYINLGNLYFYKSQQATSLTEKNTILKQSLESYDKINVKTGRKYRSLYDTNYSAALLDLANTLDGIESDRVIMKAVKIFGFDLLSENFDANNCSKMKFYGNILSVFIQRSNFMDSHLKSLQAINESIKYLELLAASSCVSNSEYKNTLQLNIVGAKIERVKYLPLISDQKDSLFESIKSLKETASTLSKNNRKSGGSNWDRYNYFLAIALHKYSVLDNNDNSMLEESNYYFRRVVKSLPSFEVDVNNAIGLNYIYLGDYVQAEKYIMKSLQAKPNSPTFLDSLGLLYSKKGQLISAEKTLFKALELATSNQDIIDINNHLLEIYHAKGDTNAICDILSNKKNAFIYSNHSSAIGNKCNQ